MLKHINIIKKDNNQLNRKEQLEFLEYLKSCLENGYSLNSSIELMEVIWSKKKDLMQTLAYRMNNGSSFYDELTKLGFSKTTKMQIKLAIQQGNLIECLSQLAVLTRLKNAQIKKIVLELTYPFVLAGMMVVLLVFMQTFVSTQFSDSQEYTGDILLFGIIILVVSGIYYFAKILHLLAKQDYDSLKKLSKYVFIGTSIKTYIEYLLIYDIGLLLSSGFSLQSMCEYSAKQERGSLQQVIGQNVKNKFDQGSEVVEIIKTEEFLPDNLLLLLRTGSNRVDLSKKCLILGNSLFNDLTQKIEQLVISIQPICFILLGLCVIGMYLKLLLPMYAMMQGI